MIVPHKTYPVKFSDYLTLLDSKRHFRQANFGDGEWSCILGLEGQNSQGGRYFPELGKALADCIQHPYDGEGRDIISFYGYNPSTKLLPQVETWLKDRDLNVPEIWGEGLDPNLNSVTLERAVPWVHKEILAAANCRGRIGPLIELLRTKRVVLVGGSHLAKLDLFDFEYVETPQENAWLQFEDIYKRLVSAILSHRPNVVLMSCGMAAKPIIWRLGKERRACDVLDTGAIWDPFVGVLSRSGYKKPAFQNALKTTLQSIDHPEADSTGSGWGAITKDFVSDFVQRSSDMGEGNSAKIEKTPEVLDAKMRVLDLIPPISSGPVLDIGAAEGWEALELERRLGKDRIECITLFEDEAQAVRAQGISRVHLGDFHSLSNDWRERYSLVFASHVLEHSPAPVIALAEFWKVLAKGGWLFLVMPNADGRTRQGSPSVKRMGDFGSHIFFPSVDTLIEMGRCRGFDFKSYHEVIQTEWHKTGYKNMVWVFRKPF